jgi:hypothetical protein
MDPVSNISQLVETLRKQLIESRANTGAGAQINLQKPPLSSGRPNVEELQKKISQKLRRIDTSDPKARQKSVHIFLESVLLWQFGEKLMDDPKFYALLDDVQRSMEADSGVREDLDRLLAQLR